MTPLTPLLPPTALLLLGAAVLAVAFEAIGADVGQRKRIARHHQSVVVVLAAFIVLAMSLAGLGPPPLVTGAVALCLAGFAVGEGAGLLGERAALALGLGAMTLTVLHHGAVVDDVTAVAFAAGSAVILAGLSIRIGDPGRADAAVEAAARQAFIGAAAVLLLGVGALVDGPVGVGCDIVGLALVVGVVPLQGPRLDLAHGASPGVAALGGLTLLALGPTLATHLLALSDEGPATVVVVVGLCGLPLVALNQVAVRRLFAVLAVLQGVLPIAAALVGHDPQQAAVVAVVAVVALALASASLPGLTVPSSSWEDVSGIGRLAPWRSGLVIFAAAQACGLPPTAGFALRTSIATTAAGDEVHFWLPVVLFLGTALAALPVVRLALFLFSKSPRIHHVPPAQISMMIACVVVVALAVVGGVVPVG